MDPAELLREAETFDNLDQAFRWAVSRSPRIVPADVIVQDEYSHDVLFKVADDCFLVFDTT